MTEIGTYWITIEGGAITIASQTTAQQTHDHAYDVYWDLMHQRTAQRAQLRYKGAEAPDGVVIDSFVAVGQTPDSLYIYEHELSDHGKRLQRDRDERIRQKAQEQERSIQE